MFSGFSALSVALPARLWRAETGFRHAPETSAADVLRFEAGRGLSLDLSAEAWAALEDAPADALLWVCFERSDAERYGEPQELALNDAPAVVLATDHKGGFLILLDLAEDDEDETMSDDEDSTSRAIDRLQAEAEKITTERGESAAAHYQQHRAAFVEGQAELNVSAVGRPLAEKEALHTEHDARKHDYAAFLAGRLYEHHNRAGDAERATDYAAVHDTHLLKAAELRGNGPALAPDAGGDHFAEPAWRSDRMGVHFGNDERVFASLVPNPEDAPKVIWLSHIAADLPDNGSHAVDFLSLAEGKSHIETWWNETGRAAARGQTPPSPDDDPNKPKGRGPAPDFGESAFLLLERSANGAQETGLAAHLFIDREHAADAAKGFPMSQEDAARQGMTTWAEVHPVTPQFAANFEAMEQAGRLDSLAALYSTSRDVNGELMPADPREPGAMKGAYREGAGETEPTRPEHYRLAAGVEPAPDGTRSTRATFYDPNENRDHPGYDAEKGYVTREASQSTNAWDAILAEAKGDAPTRDRQPGHYADLQAITGKAEDFGDSLAAVAESRDARGDAPTAREIVTRQQTEESDKRQQTDLAASLGEEKPREGNAWTAILAEARAESTKHDAAHERGEARDGAENSGQNVSSGRGGMSM